METNYHCVPQVVKKNGFILGVLLLAAGILLMADPKTSSQ
jgi:hypothetical protein